jgi:tryptophanyl-tRNA synthetase
MAKRVLSGMQPSGLLHLGNLFGALDNFKRLQAEHECFYFVADWHALSTNYENTARIREYVREVLIDWLAAGLDPERSTLFIQSRVPEHAVLYLLLSMITPLPWLERNPTYKEKQENIEGRDLSTFGFLGYPVLQTADILLYKGDVVPVGVDQLPHLELSREIARRFNQLYTPVFPEPQALLTEIPKVPGTDGRKMSKSYNNTINLSDPEATVRSKLKTMVTDPARIRRTDKGNPDVCPVFTLHKSISARPVLDQVNQDCRTAAIGCIDCKKLLADGLVALLTPTWEKRLELAQKPKMVDEIIDAGTKKAGAVAGRTVAEVSEAMRIG